MITATQTHGSSLSSYQVHAIGSASPKSFNSDFVALTLHSGARLSTKSRKILGTVATIPTAPGNPELTLRCCRFCQTIVPLLPAGLCGNNSAPHLQEAAEGTRGHFRCERCRRRLSGSAPLWLRDRTLRILQVRTFGRHGPTPTAPCPRSCHCRRRRAAQHRRPSRGRPRRGRGGRRCVGGPCSAAGARGPRGGC